MAQNLHLYLLAAAAFFFILDIILHLVSSARRRREETDIRALQRITSTVAESRDFESIINAIIHITSEALGAERGYILLYDKDKKGLVVTASKGLPPTLAEERVVNEEDRLSWWVYTHAEPVLIKDVRKENTFTSFPLLHGGNSLMCVPIKTAQHIAGVLTVTNKPDGKPFTEENLETMLSIAGHVAIIVESEINHQELLERMEELESLYNLSEQISHSLDLKETLDKITRLAVDITHTDACSLRLLNPETNELDIMACTGVGPDYKNKGSLKIGQGVGGYVAKEGVPVTIPNLRKDNRIHYTSYLEDEGLMSLVSVPIKDEEESVIGIISVYKREEYNFPESTVNLLSTFANNTAVAIKNARLFETITKNYSDTIQSLALALEAKDRYTRGHSERVTDFAVMIAKEMNLNEKDINTLRFAGKLHDIGKIAVSDKILLKEEKLTLTEYADIKMHPERGAELLKPLSFLQEAAVIIRHHHERFDGQGYPDGLKGEEIPLLARILSVADAFDAMTSERPYRASFTQQQALQEIVSCAGTQFDPQVVEVFRKIITRRYS